MTSRWRRSRPTPCSVRSCWTITPAGGGSITTIPLGRTTTPYTLNAALQDLGGNTAALDKPQFEVALQTLTDTLRDATPQLRGALDGVANLSRTLNTRDEALGNLLPHAQSVTKTLADRADQVNQLVVDGNQLFAALDERRQALSSLIAGIDDVSATDFGLRRRQPQGVRAGADQAQPVLDNLNERRDHISRGAQAAAAVRHRARRGGRLGTRLPDQRLRSATGDHLGSAVRQLLPAGQAARQPVRLPARAHRRAPGSSGRSRHDAKSSAGDC